MKKITLLLLTIVAMASCVRTTDSEVNAVEDSNLPELTPVAQGVYTNEKLYKFQDGANTVYIYQGSHTAISVVKDGE